MAIHSSVLDLIGETPIVKAQHLETGVCELYLKLESANPGGSIKDRIGLSMIEAADKRGDAVNSATLIGSLVDFADMRDWSAFVHEGHLAALEDHLEGQGFIDSLELQRLFAAMRANDLIWSSVISLFPVRYRSA